MEQPSSVHFRVLGPLRVAADGTEVAIPARRQRGLLVLLLLETGRVVPAERLADQLWDGAPPPQAAVTLRSYVSHLRRALGAVPALADALVTRGGGYVLEVAPESVDAVRLERRAEEGRAHLRAGRPEEALAAFEEAVVLWTGTPLAEVVDHAAVQGVLTRLTESHVGAQEGRFEAMLATGRHLDALPGLEVLVADQPLRETPRTLLLLALHRAGRTPEALAAHREYRTLLREELGLDPSDRFDRLEQRLLAQDPALAAPEAPAPGPSRAATVPSPAARPRPSLVGRERELALVSGHLDALAGSGAGGLLLVGGEPGIGKTTLVEALEDQARERGVAVHCGRAAAAAGAPAFWPWTRVLDSIAAGLDDEALRRAAAGPARPVAQLSSVVAERVGPVTPVGGDDPATLRFGLYEAVATFVTRAAAEQPLVITLDDVHWADVPSLELLSYLTPSLAAQPVVVAAAYRDLASERPEALDATLATVSREEAVTELSLAGLEHEDVAAMLADLPEARHDDQDGLVALLHERTGGNPFFVRQLARLLLEAGPDAGRLAGSAVPPGVRHVIARRLDDLPDPARRLLDGGAVLGRRFELATAAAVAGLDPEEALDAADEAARHGLLDHGDPRVDGREGPGFVHALVQEVVHDALPAGRAARLHARAAEQLAGRSGTTVDELAEHLWAAREVVGAGAVPALLDAAEAAAAVFAHEQAEVHLRRALRLVRSRTPDDTATELTVLLRLFRRIATDRGWGDEDARAVVDRAIALAGHEGCTDDTVGLWWSLFFFLLDRDDADAYVPVARSLVATLTDGCPCGGDATRAAIHLTGIFAALADDDRDAALEHLRQARRHIEAAPNADLAAFDEHLHVMLLLIEGYWTALTGDASGYRTSAEAAVALADADGRPFPRAVARTLGAATAPYVDEPAFGLALAEQALELTDRFGFSWLSSIAESVSAWGHSLTDGPEPDARAALESRYERIVAAGHHGNASIMLLLLADVHAQDGRPDDARACLDRAREVPGPYRGLLVDVVDRRLAALGPPG